MKHVILFFLFATPLFAAEPWDVYSDTWVATDALGRSLPDASQVGPPKKDKTVALFYFLWQGRHGEQGPFDVSKILAADPTAIQNVDHPLWGPMHAFHHWGEPIFDYYVADDDYVLRKHAQMLADADVDVIIFDVTNQQTYLESYQALCRVFMDVRKQGNRTPQIAFLTPFGQPLNVVRALWKDLYSKPDYADLWFRWKGKPFILADPAMLVDGDDRYVFSKNNVPVAATPNVPVGQSFSVDHPFRKVSAFTPTWNTTDSSASLALYEKEPGGKKLAAQTFENIRDNSMPTLVAESVLPAGTYYLELKLVSGKVGWWSQAESGKIPGGTAYLGGKPCDGTRSIRLDREPESSELETIREFFTFRKPQPSYFVGPTGPDQWSWLEVHPQHGFYSSGNEPGADGKPKKVEEVAVGIGQNAVDGKLGVLSNPRAHGRSFHDGKQPPPGQCDFSGKNFTEQWNRAFELDPEAVFVTSWNEWIMMRFPRQTPFHGSDEQATNFVDQFDREYSRDIEPMRGGHGDVFYYQMIAMNRKFKGVRSVEPIQPRPISVDGNFDDWNNVRPEFRDTIGDPAKRNNRGYGKNVRYVNETGRNDFVAAKVSFDVKSETLYFYVRTQDPIVGEGTPNWMLLYLDVDADARTGWLGYDFFLDGKTLKKNVDNDYRWETVATVEGVVHGSEYEIAIPWKSLGLEKLPAAIHFKWADNIRQTGDWSDFTLNGDVAPNDRYNYRAVFEQ